MKTELGAVVLLSFILAFNLRFCFYGIVLVALMVADLGVRKNDCEVIIRMYL